MNLYLRLVLALLSGFRGPRLNYDAPSYKTFRVWPHDLDAFGHMNNGRYLQIMDVARTEWMARTGVLSTMWDHKWSAVLGGGLTRYRRSLKLMQKYQVRTQLMHWDERWFFFEHAFIDAHGRRVAIGISRAALRNAGDWVHTTDIVSAVAPHATNLTPPAYLENWLSLDEEVFQQACEFGDEDKDEDKDDSQQNKENDTMAGAAR